MDNVGIATTDFQNLSELKLTARKDSNAALPEVAKQFEAIFLQAMMKSMRASQHFVDESSPFRGKSEETFQDMLDGQYVSKMTENGGIGLAKMLASQLQQSGAVSDKAVEKMTPNHSTSAASKSSSTVVDNKSEPKEESLIDQFVSTVLPYAKQAASVLGLDPKILLAQAALETGWGKFIIQDKDGSSSNNLFNVKAPRHQDVDSVTVKTTEYIADTPVNLSASFKKYTTLKESFNDYVSLIKNTDRYQAAADNAEEPERYIDELHRAGYATDPKYVEKILSIYNGDELQQAVARFDSKKEF